MTNDKDRLVNHWMARFKENWPRMDAGKTAQIERFLYEQKEDMIEIVSRKIMSDYKFPPVYADLIDIQNSLTASRSQQKNTEAWANLPVLTPEQHRRSAWFIANCRAAEMTETLEEWQQVMHQIADQCQRWGGEYALVAEQMAMRIANEKSRREQSRTKTTPASGRPTHRVFRHGFVEYQQKGA
jgi:hypothetical protein